MCAAELSAVSEPVPVVESARSGLRRQAARGALLTVGAQVLKIIVQLAGVVILARLLTPFDYGLVAMVTAIIGVAEIFRDFGLSSAAIQAAELSRAQRSNLFWINTGAGGALSVLVLLLAPAIAWWYARPELVGVTAALSGIFLINGLATQYRADLNRALRFRALAIVEITAPVVGLAVAIGSAWWGLGYWALVVQQLSTAFVLLVAAVVAGRWLPGLPDRRAPMRQLLNFGWHLAGSQLLGYLGNNVDSLTIGTRFGAAPLGLYNRGFQLLMTPLGQLRAPTTTVALPVLARLRDDPDGSNRFVQRGQLALGFTLVAGLGLVIGTAGPLTAVLLGGQWLAVEPILRLLALAGVFQTLAYVGYWVYVARGLTRELLRYTVLTVSIKIACILVGSIWGVIGVAWGYAVAPVIAWPLSFWWLSRKSPIAVKPLFAGAGRILILTTLVAAASWGGCLLFAGGGRWVALVAGLGSGAIAYGIGLLLPAFRRDFRGVLAIVREGLSRRGLSA